MFTSPFVITLMILEPSPPERLKYFSYLTIHVFAAHIGFAVFFAIGCFSDLLSELSWDCPRLRSPESVYLVSTTRNASALAPSGRPPSRATDLYHSLTRSIVASASTC